MVLPTGLLTGVLIAPARAQDNDFCLECHGHDESWTAKREGRTVSLYLDAERYGKSVHADLDCIVCHTDLEDTELPHRFDLARVDCGQCHDEQQEVYSQSTHGRRLAEGDAMAPLCQDCHGNHYVLPLSDPHSAVSPFNVPAMCAQCHAEGAEVARTHDIPQEDIFRRYSESIHGEGLYKQGLTVTAVCTSCHTGHRVLPHTDPNSTIAKENVTATCMKCHGRIEEVHRKLIAGELWEKEPHKIPVCVECHAPHEVRKVFYDTGMANADCLRCHGDPQVRPSVDGRSMFVDVGEYASSVHGRPPHLVACAQCHTGVTASHTERPCATLTDKVDCSICHDTEVTDFEQGVHGRLHAKGDPDAPYCTDCHGRHDTLEHAVPEGASEVLAARIRESRTYPRNVPDLCAECHREGAPAASRYLGEQEEIVKHYTESIHGKGLLQSGLVVTAICTDCHTSHRPLPSDDPASSVHADNVARTCGKCHEGIYETYARSVHSPTHNPSYRQLRGMPPLPRCNDCHASHTISRTGEEAFKLGIMDQCGKCHKDVTDTYFDTYHGKVSKLGETKTAKCQDCHGDHDILPPDDPHSRLGRNHIVQTCAECHPGSHRRFAGYLTHATHHDPDKYPALFYAFWGMTALLVGTFAFFGLHTLAWLPRSWKERHRLRPAERAVDLRQQQYVRFPSLHRKLHFVVIVSFFGLAITGMTLKFSYMTWAQALSRWLGGFESAGFIHRVCAVATFGYFVVHVWDLLRNFRRSNRTLREFLLGPNTMVPTLRDFREFVATVRWFWGRGPRPRYGRWTYWEKFDYFAVFWGVAIIGSTGLFLWFPEFFTYVFPGWLINVATIIHSDEALLATGFIFTIHFFNTHFRPEKFPMDTVIFTGRVPLEELKLDRPREYEELVARGELEEHLADPVPLYLTRGIKIFGYTALLIGITLVVLIVYTMLFGYR